ncbi:phage tail protein [Pseudomonas ficuserectae]|uniref:Prophage PSPPH06 n=2 Tax=Pseudomonas amygdali pv. lachrymans TaxID=53707 RepID=A0AB37QYD4_PSEAV|nr:phage tail protein [Pseudomonas amygdali]ARA80067.1 phage tail protein [Pseudomonas amygdali pv. lachrymans]AXH56933.1 phage tail protein [Pseudomonas amygdali pv. lachrymans str. M301315]KKY58602.1 tail protein [Pseudomonas amygdali pv. lachrymans]KPB98801.1 Prophage PSPPH06 [Pseudomonas amygdali pv. lachrymans]KPC16730.1 Prophage PSPPH06 [Pseudomonas amygdali pv. lachrymans]
MIKLKALTAYLLSRQLVAPEQLDSWTDQVQVELIWKPDTQGMHMGDMNYGATITIERFADHPARLFALVGSWLETNDQDRDGLPNVVFDVAMLDNDLADVDIKLQFTEAQYLAEDPAGEIEAFGSTWSFVPFALWVAETGEVAAHGL